MPDVSKDLLKDIWDTGPVPLAKLMRHRVREILLVSSLYDSYTFEEDGHLTEALFSEFLELNLRYAPRIETVPTADEALKTLMSDEFDLVISMPRVGTMDIREFAHKCQDMDPDLPVVLLAYNTRELPLLLERTDLEGIDRIFTWHGDVRLFLAIIKYIEDRWNAREDVETAGVQCIILLEDNVSFYSSYLPLLYTELVTQTQELMSEGLNRMERLIRMRARPKILLASTFEDGLKLYRENKDHVLGVITDVSLPRDGKIDRTAGLDFARMVHEETWDRAVLVQSSEESNRSLAEGIGAQFINKNSPTLLRDVQEFVRNYLGFGDFMFRHPDGEYISSAGDLKSLGEALHEIPEDSLMHHVTRNHFSLWLMARSEFDLARKLRPRGAYEFANPEEIRAWLITAIDEHLERRRSGIIAEFSKDTFHPGGMFVRIGDGSLGGKGRGLAFINYLLNKLNYEEEVPGVDMFVPPTTVLSTSVFDEFMKANELKSAAIAETDNDKIREMFLNASLPENAMNQLRQFLEDVHYPLAVRSSSLQEDASHQPFAGLYRTYMIPNDAEGIEDRVEQLSCAIRMVYASTYYQDPRSYFEATPSRLEEEKMAVVIQEVVGRRHGNYIYPDFAGVARSYDYYPVTGRNAEDGVVNVALGLGKTVVDGGKCVRFSPGYPKKLYQFSTVEDYLDSTQREFYALDVTKPVPESTDFCTLETNLALLGLDKAEEHGTLHVLGSVYDAENDAVYDGIGRPGVRLVTMAGVLKHAVFPLPEALRFLLRLGEQAFSCPVEIEFAVNLNKAGPDELGFLQIRPMVVGSDLQELDLGDIDPDDLFCYSDSALGQGVFDNIRDVIYVPDDRFDRAVTIEIAREIETLNARLKAESRPYLLAGPGRWGTADRFYGTPVSWAQISKVQAIIETDIKGVPVQPSQGTHFFHNITSFGIPYFTVHRRQTEAGGSIDYEWLESEEAIEDTGHVKLFRFEEPLVIAVDGKNRRGVILKPGRDLVSGTDL